MSEGQRHIMALSGGWDSTAMALELSQREPRPYAFVCTPTGDELPEMFEFWNRLGQVLGSPLVPVVGQWQSSRTGKTVGGLNAAIADYGSLPGHRQRWCTRRLKIEPFRAFIAEQTPAVSYVGLRADEEGRAGGAYDDIEGVTMRFPLREWGWVRADVVGYLEQRGIIPPERTDCARCYHQRIGEWWVLWRDHPEIWADAVRQEAETGHTFRTPRLDASGQPILVTRRGLTFASCWRDSWPARLADLATLFEAGHVPRTAVVQFDLVRSAGACRVCTL